MDWKTVTAFLTDPDLDAPLLEAGAALAGRVDAQLDVVALGIDLTQPDVFYAAAPVVLLPGAFEDAVARSDQLAALAQQVLAGRALSWTLSTWATAAIGLQSSVGEASRFSDLVISPLPYAPGRGGVAVSILEACLFAGRVPVMLVPGRLPDSFGRVVVAWNDSPESLAAARAALPVLRAADLVEVVVVDPPRAGPDEPGARLARMLSRHGCRTEVSSISAAGAPVSRALSAHVTATGADLLVMGAYGHSRLRQAILGGATRNMLEGAEFPVLLAH